jgi:hypothetical protein
MGGKSSKMGYQQLINEKNNSNSLFGSNANFKPNFPVEQPKSINNLARNKRLATLRAREFNALKPIEPTMDLTKTITNSAAKIPGIAFGKRRKVVTLKGGRRRKGTRRH